MAQPGDSLRTRRELYAGVRQAVEMLLRGLRPQVVAHDAVEEKVGFGARLGLRVAGLEPSDQIERLKELVIQPVPSRRDFLFHRQGNPEVGRFAESSTEEPGPRHTDQRVVMRLNADGVAQSRGVAVEVPLKPCVTGHGDRACAGHLVVGFLENAAEKRRHAHNGEKAAGNEIDVRSLVSPAGN